MNAVRRLNTRRQTVAILLVAVIGTLSATLASPASAHEGRDVGDYNFVVGFLEEPAYEGQLNALSLVVTRIGHQGFASEAAPEMGLETDHHHAEDDHSHDHDHEGTQSPPTVQSEGVDILTHGALFISPSIRRDESFRFEITEDLGGFGIPYHIHPGNHQGVIVVAEEETHEVVEKTVALVKDGIQPRRINVNIGDSVVWVNNEYGTTVIMSGPQSSMTSEMINMAEADAPDVSTDVEALANRVTGLSETLEMELTHLSTSTSKTLALTEVINDPGHYIAEFIPTAPGDYRVRFFGSIEGNHIDETFDSGPDTFDTVIASDAVQFPVVLESNREIRNAAQGALDTAQNLETDLDATSSTASLSMIIGIVGVSLGVLAVVMSILAITIARRRN